MEKQEETIEEYPPELDEFQVSMFDIEPIGWTPLQIEGWKLLGPLDLRQIQDKKPLNPMNFRLKT